MSHWPTTPPQPKPPTPTPKPPQQQRSQQSHHLGMPPQPQPQPHIQQLQSTPYSHSMPGNAAPSPAVIMQNVPHANPRPPPLQMGYPPPPHTFGSPMSPQPSNVNQAMQNLSISNGKIPGSVQRRPPPLSNQSPARFPNQQPPPPPYSRTQPPPPPPQQHGQSFQTFTPSYVAPRHQAPPPPQQQQQQQLQHQAPPPPQQQNQAHPPQQQQQRPVPKIDPSQMPRIPCFTRPSMHPATLYNPDITILQPPNAPIPNNIKPPEPYERFECPPFSKNASPLYLRPTMYAMPHSKKVAEQTALPMAICVQPMGREDSVPLILYPDNQSPLRCTSCQAYYNPMDTPQKNSGSTFTYLCSLCNHTTHLSLLHSQSPTMVQAIQTAQSCGVVDHLVTGNYLVRPHSKHCVVLIAVQMSLATQAFSSAILDTVLPELQQQFQLVANEMQRLHQEIPDAPPFHLVPPRIGVFYYDGHACYIPYLSTPNTKTYTDTDQQPRPPEIQLAVMTDLAEDPFSPLPVQSFTYNVTDEIQVQRFAQVLSNAQDLIPQLESSQDARAALGPALAVLKSALSETGGRAILLTSSSPNVGVGTIRIVDTKSLLHPIQVGEVTHPLDVAAAQFYKNLALDCSRESIRLDVLLVENHQQQQQKQQHGTLNLDSRAVATLGHACHSTGGKLIRIRAGLAQQLAQLCSNIQYTAMDAIFKLRLSDGIRLHSKPYLGLPPGQILDRGILNSDSPELELAHVGPETCWVMELQHSVGGIPASRPPRIVLQAALLYTTPLGQRRVRVMTLCLPSAQTASACFRHADGTAICTTLARKAVDQLLAPPSSQELGTFYILPRVAAIKRQLVDSTVDIMTSYRLHTPARDSPLGQLILPEALQLLPIWTLSMLKSRVLQQPGKSTHAAVEATLALQAVMAAGPTLIILLVHPNLYRLDTMLPQEGTLFTPSPADSAGGGVLWTRDTDQLQRLLCRPYIRLPNTTHTSLDFLQEEGIYVLDDGLELFLYIGSSVPPDVMMQMFSVERELDIAINTDGMHCIATNTSLGLRSRAVLQALQSWHIDRFQVSPVVLIYSRTGDIHMESFRNLLVDDVIGEEMSYVDFLCLLHKRIKTRMEHEQKK